MSFLHCSGVYLGMVETKRAEGHWHADVQWPISPLKLGKLTKEESQVSSP